MLFYFRADRMQSSLTALTNALSSFSLYGDCGNFNERRFHDVCNSFFGDSGSGVAGEGLRVIFKASSGSSLIVSVFPILDI